MAEIHEYDGMASPGKPIFITMPTDEFKIYFIPHKDRPMKLSKQSVSLQAMEDAGFQLISIVPVGDGPGFTDLRVVYRYEDKSFTQKREV